MRMCKSRDRAQSLSTIFRKTFVTCMMNLPCSTLLSFFASLVLLSLLVSCQDINSAITPGSKSMTDDFDGSKVITQAPVSSSSTLAEAWHTLGFDWSSKTPDRIFLTAGVQGTNNVFGLDFNVGGRVITASEA